MIKNTLFPINENTEILFSSSMLLDIDWEEIFARPRITEVDPSIASIAIASFDRRGSWSALKECFRAFLTRSLSTLSQSIIHPYSKSYSHEKEHNDVVFIYETYLLKYKERKETFYRSALDSNYSVEKCYTEYMNFIEGRGFDISCLEPYGLNSVYLSYYNLKTEEECILAAESMAKKYDDGLNLRFQRDNMKKLILSMIYSSVDSSEVMCILEDYLSERQKDNILGSVIAIRRELNRLSEEDLKDPFYDLLKNIDKTASIILYNFIDSVNYLQSADWENIILDKDLPFIMPKMRYLKDKYKLGDFLKNKIQSYYS